ncbi:MAG: LptA/OstA family protein [Pseudomonadota bacterium]
MKRNRSAILTRAGSFVALIVMAASLAALPADAQKKKSKVNIESDQMQLLESENKAVFSGNVRAQQNNVRLRSSKLTATFVKTKNGGTDVTRLETDRRGVKIITSSQTITGDHMRMNVKANTAVVTGNVTVIQGTSVVKGQKLNVNLNTNESKFSSVPGSKVKFSFNPDPD